MSSFTLWFRAHWPLLALFVGVLALWSTPVLLPLKILVVFFHELAHLLTLLATGGTPTALSLTANEGGAVTGYGGNRFLVLSAGYLGSLLIGLALFQSALSTRADRWIMGALGLLLLAVAALYIRQGFALGFTVAAGGLMLASARFLPHGPNDFLLRLIGLSSMIYVPLDIISDTLARAHLDSDARMLAREIGGTTMIWGLIWLALALVIIAIALRSALRHPLTDLNDRS